MDASASDTDSVASRESVHSDDITNLVRELVVVVEEQKELILNVSKKQNEISKEIKKKNGKFETLNKKVLEMDLNLTQQAESLEFVHAEVKDFKEIKNDT